MPFRRCGCVRPSGDGISKMRRSGNGLLRKALRFSALRLLHSTSSPASPRRDLLEERRAESAAPSALRRRYLPAISVGSSCLRAAMPFRRCGCVKRRRNFKNAPTRQRSAAEGAALSALALRGAGVCGGLRSRALQVQRQQPGERVLLAEIGGPAIGGSDRGIELAMGIIGPGRPLSCTDWSRCVSCGRRRLGADREMRRG